MGVRNSTEIAATSVAVRRESKGELFRLDCAQGDSSRTLADAALAHQFEGGGEDSGEGTACVEQVDIEMKILAGRNDGSIEMGGAEDERARQIGQSAGMRSRCAGSEGEKMELNSPPAVSRRAYPNAPRSVLAAIFAKCTGSSA